MSAQIIKRDLVTYDSVCAVNINILCNTLLVTTATPTVLYSFLGQTIQYSQITGVSAVFGCTILFILVSGLP